MSAYGAGVLAVSELIRKSPCPAVDTWAAGRHLEYLFCSAVGEAELRHGVISQKLFEQLVVDLAVHVGFGSMVGCTARNGSIVASPSGSMIFCIACLSTR